MQRPRLPAPCRCLFARATPLGCLLPPARQAAQRKRPRASGPLTPTPYTLHPDTRHPKPGSPRKRHPGRQGSGCGSSLSSRLSPTSASSATPTRASRHCCHAFPRPSPLWPTTPSPRCGPTWVWWAMTATTRRPKASPSPTCRGWWRVRIAMLASVTPSSAMSNAPR